MDGLKRRRECDAMINVVKFETMKYSVTVTDDPGWRDYFKNLIAGISQVLNSYSGWGICMHGATVGWTQCAWEGSVFDWLKHVATVTVEGLTHVAIIYCNCTGRGL